MKSKLIAMSISIIFILSLCPSVNIAALSNNTITLNDVNIDYTQGVITVSGKVDDWYSGVRVSIEIVSSTNETVFADQATSTSKGAFTKGIKINSLYKTGLYTVKASATDASVSAQKTFDFNDKMDNYYISNVFIEGAEENQNEFSALEDTTLSVKFDFFSSFSYKIGETVYQWQASGSKNGNYFEIKEATSSSLAFTASDAQRLYNDHPVEFADKNIYIRCAVKAKTQVSTDFCETQISENCVNITTVPFVTGVKVEGTGKVGSTLTGDYTYADFQEKKEQNSEYKWLASSSANGNYTELAFGISYIPSKADAGKYLKFQVTPKSAGNTVGKSVISSNYIKVTGSSEGSSGGGGGGGGGSPIIAPPIKEPVSDLNGISIGKNEGFTDVPKDYWAKNDIDEIVKRGDANGVLEKEFKPEAIITRAEFSKLILNVLKKSAIGYNNEFTDVTDGDWYAGIVSACADLNLVGGYNGAFRPNDPITREEMSKVIMLTYKVAKPEDKIPTAAAQFKDESEISDWAKEYVAGCVGLALITGLPEGTFNPKENATRAQAVVIINRLYRNIY